MEAILQRKIDCLRIRTMQFFNGIYREGVREKRKIMELHENFLLKTIGISLSMPAYMNIVYNECQGKENFSDEDINKLERIALSDIDLLYVPI